MQMMGVKSVDEGLVGARRGIEAHGKDVEHGDEAVLLGHHGGRDEHDGRGEDGGGHGEGLVEDVDVAHLEGHVAQKAAAQAAEGGKADGAHEVEFLLACGERTRHRGDNDGDQLDSTQARRQGPQGRR